MFIVFTQLTFQNVESLYRGTSQGKKADYNWEH